MTDNREKKRHMTGRGQMQGTKADRVLYAVLFLAAVVLFLAAGSGEPVLFDDSTVYLRVRPSEGVMPVYPLFILLNQYLFGDVAYLQAVIIEQALLAAFCIVLFVVVVRKQFALKGWESCIIFCFLLYPYTIEMPAAMMTQIILTEGVAYSFFYLAVILFLKAVWNRHYGFLAGAAGVVFVLALTRSQLQILFGVCGIIYWYIVCMRRKQGDKKSVLLRILSGAAVCLMISLTGVLVVSRIGSAYQRTLDEEGRLFYLAMKVQDYEDYLDCMEEQQELIEEQKKRIAQQNELAGQQDNAKISVDDLPKKVWKKALVDKPFTVSQHVSLIFSRGMYEADSEDVSLFEDEVLQGLFLKLYETADAQEQLHSYAKQGLWMWKDIVDGIGMIGKTCFMTPSEYYVAEYPEIIQSDEFSNIRNTHLTTIGMTLVRAHFGRFLYHTLMLLPQAFVSTVFFQMAPVYLLCHLVTLFLYLSAFAMMIWAYVDRRVDNRYAEFMAFVLGSNVVIVVLISIVFFGQQRYLVYNFGVFYTAYYLLLRQLWRCRVREWVSCKRIRGCATEQDRQKRM